MSRDAIEDPQPLDFDWVVVGSDFGGSVAAMRLAEKGSWAPALGLRGIALTITALAEHGMSQIPEAGLER